LRAYIATRLATAVLVILGVSLVSFLLTFLTGDPAEIMLPPGATADQITAFRAAWGFDDPLPVRLFGLRQFVDPLIEPSIEVAQRRLN